MSAAIVCDGKELETYDVKQEGTSLLTAFISSEAGKQFKIKISNNLTNFGLTIFVHIDGQLIQHMFLRPKSSCEFLGPYKSICSIHPLKFQELQLVDLDLEDVPVAPEIGTIELKALRCQEQGTAKPIMSFKEENLHKGCVSERSKKGGWHHVATGEETPIMPVNGVNVDYLDSTGLPYASMKILYRPRELLRAQGIIPVNNADRQEPPIENKKRSRGDGSPSSSRNLQKIKVKSEELSGDARAERIRTLKAELDALNAGEQSSTLVKRELRSPSPIIVKHPGEVVDLTLED